MAEYRDFMIRHLDDSHQVEDCEQSGVRVYKSEARISGPRRVEVDGGTLESKRITVATGSDAKVPPIPRIAEAGYWTNRDATTLRDIPDRIVVLGGGRRSGSSSASSCGASAQG